MSEESGLGTFRGSGGLWSNYSIEDVATLDGYRRNPHRVTEFYNRYREWVAKATPNQAHAAIADLQRHFDVQVITQNVDDLHERAGSKKVLHLHGEIFKARSRRDPSVIVDLNGDLSVDDKGPDGARMRPHIVWFGEDVPAMQPAMSMARSCELFVVVGTSLQVYPAANLLQAVSASTPSFLVDPNEVESTRYLDHWRYVATRGVPKLAKFLVTEYL